MSGAPETPYRRPPGYPGHYRDRRFATGHGPGTDRRERRILAGLLGGPDGAPRGRWIDVPSGAGRLTGALPGPAVQVDRTWAMLAASPVPGPRVCASALRLPFADGAFAGGLCMRLLQHLPTAGERVAVLAELRRVVAGPLVVSYFEARSLQHLRRLLRRRTGKPTSGRSAVPGPRFAAEAAAAGWRIRARRPLRRWISEQTLVLLEAAPS